MGVCLCVCVCVHNLDNVIKRVGLLNAYFPNTPLPMHCLVPYHNNINMEIMQNVNM
jgi:hypothetical protein